MTGQIMVRGLLGLGILIAVAGVLAIVVVYPPIIDELKKVVAEPLPEDIMAYGITIGLVLGGVVLTLLGRSVSSIEILALVCVWSAIVFVASQLIPVEISFARLMPKEGAAGGWKPGEARAEFLSPWYWIAASQLSASALGAAVLFGLSRLRSVPTQS
ncbi:MAG: hypothetical protein EON89_11020 [Brevundimonas sp.]|nr:MAG: hypothetical protein EON89_11020 [Brevundimonas sp.]